MADPLTLYHFPGAMLLRDVDPNNEKFSCIVSPSKTEENRHGYSRNDFTSWEEPRTFWYVGQCNDVEPQFKGKKMVLRNSAFETDALFYFNPDNITTFESVTGANLQTMTTHEYFDAMQAYAKTCGCIGFSYIVQNRRIAVIWTPIGGLLENVSDQ